MARERRADCRDKIYMSRLFPYEPDRADSERIIDDFLIRMHGADDNPALRHVLPKQPRRVEPAHPRHRHIQDDYVRMQPKGFRHHCTPVLYCPDHLARLLRDSAEIRQNLWMIVGQ